MALNNEVVLSATLYSGEMPIEGWEKNASHLQGNIKSGCTMYMQHIISDLILALVPLAKK